MAIKFQCPGCGVEDVADETMAGQQVTCGGCGKTIRLPRASDPPGSGDTIRFRCDGCGKALAAPAHLAGKKITCKACGRTGVKIPGGSARPAPAPSPPSPRPAPAPEPAAGGLSAADLYGLEDAPASPTPRLGSGGTGLFAGLVGAVLDDRPGRLGRGAAAAGQGVRADVGGEEEADQQAGRQDQQGEALVRRGGVGRVVRDDHRHHPLRLAALPEVAHKVTRGWTTSPPPRPPSEPGQAFDPEGRWRPSRISGRRADTGSRSQSPPRPASGSTGRASKHPNHVVFEMGNDRARAGMIAGFYERGARRVSGPDADTLGNNVVAAVIGVELPDRAREAESVPRVGDAVPGGRGADEGLRAEVSAHRDRLMPRCMAGSERIGLSGPLPLVGEGLGRGGAESCPAAPPPPSP